MSNITIQNKTGSPIQTYGLYIKKLARVDITQTSCDGATTLYASDEAAGAVVTSVPFQKNQIVQLGQNYLYNMILTAIYYEEQTVGSLPCALPGCSWENDAIPYHWCIDVGVLSPSSNNTSSTANVPPFGDPVAGAGYSYKLVTQYTDIGPITCNDQSLTCSIASAQNEAFPS